MTPLLEIEQLSVDFDTDDGIVHAVDRVTLTVDRGQILGVVGESGSGKSVTGLTLMGLTRGRHAHIRGQAMFDGRDLLALSDAELQRLRGNEIAMIFQDPLSSLHPFYTVGRQLIEAVRVHQPDVGKAGAQDRALEMLRLVGIPDPRARLSQYPYEFSGGMRQRVMIAMALLNDPKLLIADEPTTALDVTVQAQILELIQRLQAELGMAVIMITHDLGVVAELADEVAVMYGGEIVERAATTALFAAPEHPYTWGLLGSIPRLDQDRGDELVPVGGTPPSLINRPSGCRFHPRCPYVRDEHRRTHPPLVSLPTDSRHSVACLLPQHVRRSIWAQLREGADPATARAMAEDTVLGVEGGSERD